MTDIHPAVLASERSAQYAMAKNKEGWLSLFAEDAFLADPVGKSPLDPTGEGYQGKARITEFWDKVIGRADLVIEASQRIPCANACAAVLRATNELPGGNQTVVDMVGIYEVNDEGLLISLKVYWDFSDLTRQLGAFAEA